MAMNINQAVLAADWQLLRRQKATLVALANNLQAAGVQDHEDLDGIIHYLDAVMDAAAEVVGAVHVFGAPDAQDALAQIHAILDGTSWDADTLDAIAEVIRSSGFNIRPPDAVG